MGKGPYRSRDAKVIKFSAALNLATGEVVPFETIKSAFFKAANDPNPKAALRALRKEFKMACPSCRRAKLVFSFASENADGTINRIAGTDIPGNPAHLKTKSTKGREIHLKHCTGVVVEKESSKVDPEKGFLLYLNLKNIPEPHPHSKRLIMREPGGKIVRLDPDLKGRESHNISTPADVLTLMRSGKTERLNSAVAVYGNQKIRWSEFLIPSNDTRDPNPPLGEFARTFFKENIGHPIMIDLKFLKATASNYSDDDGRNSARHYKFPKTAPIFVPGLGEIVIQPELRVKNEHLVPSTEALHRHQGEAFVMVERPFLYKRDTKTNIYMMPLVLVDPDMIIESNFDDIMAIANKRRDVVHKDAGVPPPALT